jgi:hypothetical protein
MKNKQKEWHPAIKTFKKNYMPGITLLKIVHIIKKKIFKSTDVIDP